MAKEEAMDIARLHQKCKAQGSDLYSFLEKELPHLDIEKRLKVMAEVLNEYFEEYEYDSSKKIKRDVYSITQFHPKK